MKKKIFAANWKLNKTPSEANNFVFDLKSTLSNEFYFQNEVFIFPQNFSLDAVAKSAINSKIQFGPQQIHSEIKGAFTGENSLEIAQKMGSKICLIGHSERRQFFSETDKAINFKAKLCQSMHITPVVCIGESLAQQENNETEKICLDQLKIAVNDLDQQQRIVFAYEPVWAIGTGKVATAEQVKSIHHFLFTHLTDVGFKDFQILYGGSVKKENAKELLSTPHVDGFLIGAASLDVKSFSEICLS